MSRKKILNESDYYDVSRALSYNAVWNFIIGARGLGKTFCCKKLVINDWIKNRWQFIYLRRTAEEQKSKGTFFADIADQFPDYEFRVNGDMAQIHRIGQMTQDGKKKQWDTIGFFIALSQSGQVKSVAFPNVRTIVFDEIFPDNGRYLGNEVTALNEFYSTVDRWNDRVRIIMCSNAVSLANPYFARYQVNVSQQMNDGRQFVKYCDGFILVELADYGGFSAKVAKSRFGRFIENFDSDYANYAIRNRFRDDSNQLISDDGISASAYAFSIRTAQYGEFAIYSRIDVKTAKSEWIVSRRQPPVPKWRTFDFRQVSENCLFLGRSDDITRKLTTAFSAGMVRFDSTQSKSEFSLILGALLQQSINR